MQDIRAVGYENARAHRSVFLTDSIITGSFDGPGGGWPSTATMPAGDARNLRFRWLFTGGPGKRALGKPTIRPLIQRPSTESCLLHGGA